MQLTKALLQLFGDASGLQTNLQKSCVIPIQCNTNIMERVDSTLHCPVSAFPSNYLGLPISDKKLRKRDLLVWIEKIANKLPGWKAPLLSLAGRAVLVKAVLTAIPIYLLIALKVPKWFIRSIDKIRRNFLWKGRKEANGGCCLVAWEKVMRPLDLGGLGIHNLEIMSWALQMRWLWIEKTNPDALGWSEDPCACPLLGDVCHFYCHLCWRWKEHSFLVRSMDSWQMPARFCS